MFSLEALKKADPRMGHYYKNVVKAEKTGERQVTFTFDVKGNRELPQIVGELPVLPKHYWEGKAANGEQRDICKTTLEPPLGSGPYKHQGVGSPAATIVYERVKDYWAKDLPVMPAASGTSTRSASNITATACRRSRLQGRRARLLAGDDSASLGTAYDVRRCHAKGWSRGMGPLKARRRYAGVRVQYAPPAIPGRPRAPGTSISRSTSSGPTEPVLWAVCAHQQLFRELGAESDGRCRKGANSRS